MAIYSGKLKTPYDGMFAAIRTMMQRESRLKELVHAAGGSCETVQDEVIVNGLTADQFITITNQLDKEFPL